MLFREELKRQLKIPRNHLVRRVKLIILNKLNSLCGWFFSDCTIKNELSKKTIISF